jgi:large subunit ribosomal protein L21
MEQTRAEKVIVFKMKRRKGYKRTRGHQQEITLLRIDKIEYDMTPEIMSKAISLIK